MNEVLTFFICYIILALSVAGFGKLVMVVIAPGEIFGRWQKVLAKVRNEFWYKSLGGCATCTRQRLAELTFTGFAFFWNYQFNHFVFYLCPLWLKVFLCIGVYLLFCGLVIYFGSIIEYEKKKVEAIEKEYPGEQIIKQSIK
jgi:hypothetical protein